jgi:hypothetical protein
MRARLLVGACVALFGLFGLVSSGCGDNGTPADSGTPTDAGATTDAGHADGG